MKKFYNKTIMSRAFSSALRVFALLCVLLGVYSNAFAWDNEVVIWKSGEGKTYHDISSGSCTINLSSTGDYYFFIKDNKDNGKEKKLSGYSQMTNGNSTDWRFDGTNSDCGLKVNNGETGNFTFNLRWENSTPIVSVVYPKYYAKYNWDGNDWYWKEFDTNNQITGVFHNGCMNVDTSENDNANCYNIVKNGTINDGTPCTFTWNPSNNTVTATPISETWYLKHPWAGSNDWTWKELTHVSGTTYTITAQYSSTSNVVGFNYNTKADGDGQGYADPTINCFPASTNENCIITFDSETKKITVEPTGGCPPPNMPGAMGDCQRIEIYSKNNYNLYAVQDGKGISGNYGTGAITDATKGTQVTYNGKTYYKYYIEDYEYVQIAFKNSNGNKTGLSNKLYGGYAYIFDDDYTLDASGTIHAFPSSYNYADCSDPATIVLLSKEAVVNKTTKKAILYGYIKQTNCENILDYGFYYCRVPDGDKCKPDQKSTKLQVATSNALLRSQDFSAELVLEDGYTYYYRAYANVGTEVLSQEIRSISTDPCKQQVCCEGPVIYTINAAFEQDNVCKLEFRNLQDAIDHLTASALRNDSYAYAEFVGSSYNLKQPVVMNVVYYDDTPDDPTSSYCYRGKQVDRNTVLSAGADKPDHMLFIENINKTATNKANTLTIKAGTTTAKPWIHHILIRESKNIVLDSLIILSDPNGEINDNALEIDVHMQSYDDNGHKEPDWGSITKVGQFEDANILIQNSMIGSAGFTGVHVSSYDGVTFKNNDFELQVTDFTENTIKHGASAKFMFCSGIKFIQNNFRGDHATLMWIQESANMLIMNNVFWNTNGYYNKDYPTPSAIRLFAQWDKDIENIGIFYNTFYLADNPTNNSLAESNYWKYNILKMEHRYNDGSIDNIIDSKIKFQYNNCYSYDANVAGRESGNTPFGDKTTVASGENYCPNNFWSEYDHIKGNTTTSAFAFGCSDNECINVKGQVCETTASGPASLIVKGEAMNLGKAPEVAFTGIAVDNVELRSDRYLTNVRPASDTWTYGAYQSKETIPTSVIYWVGLSDKWDDRNNWEYETLDIETGKMIRQRVSCVNELSENLKVIIEEIGTMEISGGRKWPKVPASFDATERKQESGIPESEQVSAGKKFASTIELEYGAGLRGVENLKDADGNMLYNNALVHFDADRSKWLLVGSIVKPFVNGTDNNGGLRNVNSGDYFKQFMPQVYMRETVVDGDMISWTQTFPDLDTEVLPNTVFAINIPDEYGEYFKSAATYNKENGTNYDPTAFIPYTFNGRFVVSEDNQPNQDYVYTGLSATGKNLLNNVYPCNLDAKLIESADMGTISVYDYENGAFVSTDATGSDIVTIKAQQGFVFTPKTGTTFRLNDAILAEGSTRTRAQETELPTFSLQVDNANTTEPGASNVVLRMDREQEGLFDAPLNTPKVFTRNLYTPEAYIINKDAYYSRLYVGNGVAKVPLGISLRRAMNITFQQVYNRGFSSMVLVDEQTGKEYDLLNRSYTTEKLPKGTTEGRFYLRFAADNIEETLPDDEDVTTDVDQIDGSASINIYAVDQQIIKVVANNVELQTIYVNDMTGRMMSYDASGSYAELRLPVAQGVYLVHVVGDKATRTEKVVIK